MSDTQTPNQTESSTDQPATADSEVMQREIIGPDGNAVTVEEIASDISVGHRELDEYKRGALNMCKTLDEAIAECEAKEDVQSIAMLRRLKHMAFGLYLRLKRGDDEIYGQRDGRFSGYLTPVTNGEGV